MKLTAKLQDELTGALIGLERATFKIIKTEFIWNERFHDLDELRLKLWDYVNWYNQHQIHSSLGYQTPVQFRENNLKKVV